MIIGLDNGFQNTKTSEGIIFPSTIKTGKDIDINKDTINVNIDGIDYTVGAEDGEGVADNNKTNSLVTEICTITAIAMSFPESTFIEADVVAGLPIAFYSSQKEAFKEKLLSYGVKRIKIGEHFQDIKIKSVMVYPQSVGVAFLNAKDIKNDDTLIIDIGGSTVDISHFEGMKLINKATYPLGMLKLYSNLVQRIVSEHDVNIAAYQMDNKLQKGYITSKTGKIDLGQYGSVIDEHVRKVANAIKTDFKTHDTMDNTFIIGGGGIRLFDKIKPLFNNAELIDNAQFVNANAFKYMGELKSL